MLKELILTRSFKGKNCIELFQKLDIVKLSRITAKIHVIMTFLKFARKFSQEKRDI